MKKVYPVLLVIICLLAINISLAATYIVNTTSDLGNGSGNSGSLRYCITQANANAGPHTITFSGLSAGNTITLTGDLPVISRNDVTIDATTTTGYITNQAGINLNANGNNYGFHVSGAARVKIYGFQVYNATDGIAIEGDAADGFVIGAAGKRNFINRCSGWQIKVSAADNGLIQNNYIGCNVTGTAGYSTTASGLYLLADANNNTIGGAATGEGNLLAGGSGAAVYIGTYFGDAADGSSGNTFYGNTFGGDGPSMAWWSWVFWIDGNSDNNIIGGVQTGQGNSMVLGTNGNTANGYGNLVIAVNEAEADGNVIRGNNMRGAYGYGIVLAANGNNGQAAPTVSGQSGNILSGTATANAAIDLYTGSLENSVYGNCKGAQYITSATADAQGDWSIDLSAFSTYNDSDIVVTATDAANGTSEFSACFGPLVIGAAPNNSCVQNGNVVIYSNYDGGYLNINVDQNIPNLKVGITTYEKCEITFSGPYVNNITQVIYAGFNGQNNHCSPSPATTVINGVPSNITTIYCANSCNNLASATLNNSNGSSFIICNYSCDSATSQGGCNTPDQIVDYYITQFGGSLRSHFTQYGCWSGTYKISEGGNCCIGSHIKGSCTNPGNAGAITGSSQLCAGQKSVSYGVSPIADATGYNWTLPAGASIISGNNTNSITVDFDNSATSGDISVYGTNTCGDGASSSMAVTTHPLPVAGTLSPLTDTVCSGTEQTINASGNSNTLRWQMATSLPDFSDITATTATSYTSIYNQTTYLRVIADSAACSDTSAVALVVVKPTPVVPALNISDSTICSGDSSQICAPGGMAAYQWNNSDTGSCTQAKAAGGYWVTVTAANGCQARSGNSYINVYPVPSVSIIVQGDTLQSFGAATYQWLKNGESIPGATDNMFIVQECGSYSLQISDNNGCPATSQEIGSICSGIDDMNEGSMEVYPNPNRTGVFNLILTAIPASDHAELYDLRGRLIWKAELTGSSSIINLNTSAGVYILHVQAGHRVFNRKLVMQ